MEPPEQNIIYVKDCFLEKFKDRFKKVEFDDVDAIYATVKSDLDGIQGYHNFSHINMVFRLVYELVKNYDVTPGRFKLALVSGLLLDIGYSSRINYVYQGEVLDNGDDFPEYELKRWVVPSLGNGQFTRFHVNRGLEIIDNVSRYRNVLEGNGYDVGVIKRIISHTKSEGQRDNLRHVTISHSRMPNPKMQPLRGIDLEIAKIVEFANLCSKYIAYKCSDSFSLLFEEYVDGKSNAYFSPLHLISESLNSYRSLKQNPDWEFLVRKLDEFPEKLKNDFRVNESDLNNVNEAYLKLKNGQLLDESDLLKLEKVTQFRKERASLKRVNDISKANPASSVLNKNGFYPLENIDEYLNILTLDPEIRDSELDLKTRSAENFDTGKIGVGIGYLPFQTSGGGDYFHSEFTEDGNFRLRIADVSGHGKSAAYDKAILVEAMKTATSKGIGRNLEKYMEYLNNRLSRDLSPGKFVSFSGAEIDVEARIITYSGQGFYVVKKDGTFLRVESTGPPLGMINDVDQYTSTHRLDYGDKILFYTDGVIEAKNMRNERFGHARIGEFLRRNRKLTSAELESKIAKELDKFTKGAHRSDDITFMIVEIKDDRPLIKKTVSRVKEFWMKVKKKFLPD